MRKFYKYAFLVFALFFVCLLFAFESTLNASDLRNQITATINNEVAE